VRLARSLEAEFADAHTLSRYGGDEFVVLLPCDSPEAAAERVQKLVSGDTADPVPVSIGLAVWPHHEATLDATLAAADECLRAAKRTKKGSLVTPGA
jgi:diguanylate cyclase (GGDEF)-like protein